MNRFRKKSYGKELEKKRKRFRKSYLCNYMNVLRVRISDVTSIALIRKIRIMGLRLR